MYQAYSQLTRKREYLVSYLIKHTVIVNVPQKEFVFSKTRFTFSITYLVLSLLLSYESAVLCEEMGKVYECGFDVVSQTFTKKYPDSNAVKQEPVFYSNSIHGQEIGNSCIASGLLGTAAHWSLQWNFPRAELLSKSVQLSGLWTRVNSWNSSSPLWYTSPGMIAQDRPLTTSC